MKVKRLIEKLQKCDPEATVKLHDPEDCPVYSCARYIRPEKLVVLSQFSDIDVSETLAIRFQKAAEEQLDELSFFHGAA